MEPSWPDPAQPAPAADPLKVFFDPSAGPGLRAIVLADMRLFVEVAAEDADLVIFGTDEIGYLLANSTFRRYRHRSVCLTETDTPSFLLPGLYAANRSGRLTRYRAKTINYCLSAVSNANAEVKAIREENVSKQYLYSFMGGTNSWARRRLLRYVPSRADTFVAATDSYNHWRAMADGTAERSAKRRFAEVMAASRYVLCPRGCGLSSYRLFETMSLGIAPVVIADGWQPIDGIDWRFALFVPESRIRRLDEIVRAHADEWEQRGSEALTAYTDHLHPDRLPATLRRGFDAVRAERHSVREAVMAPLARARFAGLRAYWHTYGLAKRVVLSGYRVAGRQFPFPLHQPAPQQPQNGEP